MLVFVNKENILEKLNTFFIKDNTIFSPSKNIYKGVTYNFFKKKLGKIINKEYQLIL